MESMLNLKKKISKAVKAIIYREDGSLLMQQRDNDIELPFANCWNFFGGSIHTGELVEVALERELKEELGLIPGFVSSQLFEWEYFGDWQSTINYFFPVKCEVDITDIKLQEGQNLRWFKLDELVEIPLTPVVYENISEIINFVLKYDSNIVSSIEKNIISHNKLTKKNDRVFYANKNPFSITRQQLSLIKELAFFRGVDICRICLHINNKSDIHEMLMMHTQPSSTGPLKQDKTSISYHIIEGELEIKLYDNNGNEVKNYNLNSHSSSTISSHSLRLNANQYRSIHSKSNYTLFLETASGPFKDSDTYWLNP